MASRKHQIGKPLETEGNTQEPEVSELPEIEVTPSSPVAVAVPESRPVRVVKGKSVNTLRGIRKSGDVVKATDFPGGQSRLDEFLSAGYLELA